MFCEKCGKKLDDDTLFCGNCGNKIEPIHKMAPRDQSNFDNSSSHEEIIANNYSSKYLKIGFAVIGISIIYIFVQFFFLDFIDTGSGWWRLIYFLFAIVFAVVLFIGIKSLIPEIKKSEYPEKASEICSTTNNIIEYMLLFYGATIVICLILSGFQFNITSIVAWIPFAIGIGAKIYFGKQISNVKNQIKKYIIFVTIIVSILIANAVIREVNYNRAENYFNDGEYSEAIKIYRKMYNYKDTNEKIYECENNIIRNSEIGDNIYFGNYNNIDKWIVLDKTDNMLLIVNMDCVGISSYNNKYVDVTWEDCSLRKWLNDDYYNKAFTDDEKNLIYKDVFLLSEEEAIKYFEDKRTKFSRYASFNDNSTFWWLRSTENSNEAPYVIPYYYSYNYKPIDKPIEYNHVANHVTYENGIRPALWVKIK